MAICGHLAPNGEKSILYDELFKKYGEAKAHDMWEAIRSQQFLNKEGDWTEFKSPEQVAAMTPKAVYAAMKRTNVGVVDAHELVLDYLGTGGKIGSRSIKLAGLDSKLKGEEGYREYASPKDSAQSIDELAYELWSGIGSVKDRISQKEVRAAIVDVITRISTRADAAREYINRYKYAIDHPNITFDANGEPTMEWVESKLPTNQSTTKTEVTHTFSGTKDRTTKRVPENKMVEQIDKLVEEAKANPDKTYILPYESVSNRRKNDLGYTGRQMARLLDREDLPDNVQLTSSMRQAIANSARNIIKEFTVPEEFTTPIAFNRELVEASAGTLLIPRVVGGEKVGYFSPSEQRDLIDTIVTATQRIYSKDPLMKDKSIMMAMKLLTDKATLLQEKMPGTDMAKTYEAIHNARVQIAEMALRQLGSLGLRIDTKTKDRILDAVEHGETPGIERQEWNVDKPVIDEVIENEHDGSFLESTGRISRDWSDNVFELDPKDTASARIKMFMGTLFEMDKGTYKADKNGEQMDVNPDNLTPQESMALAKRLNRKPFWNKDEAGTEKLLKYLETKHSKLVKDTFMGTPKIADYDNMFKKTLTLLGNRPQTSTIEEFMQLLEAHPDPTMQQMSIELQKADQSVKNEFMTVMMKQYQSYITTLYNKTSEITGRKGYTLNPINSNRGSQRNSLIDYWKEQQKLSEITVLSPTGERILDTERIQKEWVPVLRDAQKVTDWSTPQSRLWFVDKVGEILNLSGMGVPDEMLHYMFQYPKNWSNATSVEGLFATNRSGEPIGSLAIFIMKSGGLTRIMDNSDPLERTKLSQLNNPLYTEGSLMNNLAKLHSKYVDAPYSSNHRNAKGKNVWDWGMNTKLSHAFRAFAATGEDFRIFAENADKNFISQNNWLIKALRENPAQITDMELNYMDALKPTWSKRGTDRQGMSDREQMVQSLALFQNTGNGFNRNSKVNYLSLTHSDKTMTPVFKNLPKLRTGEWNKIPAHIVGADDSAMFNVFKSEYNRILGTQGVDFQHKQFDKGKGLFYFMPEFNYDGMKELVRKGTITQEEMDYIYPAGQRQITKVIDSNREMPVINKVLESFVNNRVDRTLDAWRANNIVGTDSFIFDRTYVMKLMSENGIKEITREGRTIDESPTKLVDIQGNEITQEEFTHIISKAAAKDYAINTYLFNTSLSQLFYGDPAENYKPSKDKGATELDHIKSTMVEYAKRLAKDIAPKADLYWGNKRKYNTITVKDVETSDKYLADVAALKKYYADDTTTSTDAQEVTTVQEKLDVLFAAGQIHSTIYEQMSNIIKNASGGYYEFTQPEHFEVIMQPEKPLYAGTRESRNGVQLTDYVKSSAWSLYPPFTKGRPIDKLRLLMEGNNIARANFESAKKLGNPIKPLDAFNADGTFKDVLPAALKASTQTLSRDGFGIQQEVPYDAEKEAIKTLTQMNDGIVEGISTLTDIHIPGQEPMNGTELKAYKEQIRKELLQHNLDNFYDKLNIDENGTVDPELIFDILEEEAKADVRNTYTLNEIQSLVIRGEDGVPLIPLTFNPAVDKFEGTMMSMVNRISEVKMPGKSYVQASSTGINYKGYRLNPDVDLNDMIKLGNWNGEPLKTLRPDPSDLTKTLPAQVILPFNFYDSNGTKLKVKDFLKPGTNELDLDKVPKELLQLVGGRIPNQSHSSMLPMEIVGFVPDNMGDLVFIPAAVVKQMGSDFDVDKLYAYKRPYTYDKETGSFRTIATGRSTEDVQRPIEAAQTDYFNIHWGILSHPDMLERVLRPLDQNDLKEESVLLKKPETGDSNFYDPINQLEDFQRGKEAKRLVGSTSWGKKFNDRIQDKNLYITKFDLNEEGTSEVVPDKILVRDEHTGEIKELGRLSGNGVSHYSTADGGTDTTPRTKGINHVMVQSESVDNAKYRTLDNLNLTPDTYKAAQAFIQLQTDGDWAANSKYWTRLLTQPIVWEFSKLMKQGNDSLSEKYNPALYKTTVDQLRSRYKALADGELSNNEIHFDPQLLLKAQSELTGNEYIEHQLAALDLFDKLYQVGQRMFELEAQFTQDVSGAGASLFAVMDKVKNMDDLDRMPIANASDLYRSYDGSTFQKTEVGFTFDALNYTALDTLSQVLPYRNLSRLFSQLSGMINRNGLTGDQQKSFLRALRSTVFTSGEHWWKAPQVERVKLIYGPDSVAKRLGEAQKTWGKDNPFIARLKTVIGDTNLSPDYVTYSGSSKAMETEVQGMSSGWLHLLLSDVPAQRTLGEDLLRYAYLSNGIQDANSFVKFIPATYVANTEFAEMLRAAEDHLKDTTDYENDGLLIQHVQHNPDMVPQVPKELFGEMEGDREFPEAFKIPTEYDGPDLSGIVGADGQLLPFVSYRSNGDGKWILYMRNWFGSDPYYTRIDTLGNEFMDEYNGQVSIGQRSIFEDNRSLAENIPALELQPVQPVEDMKRNGSFNDNVSHYDQIGFKEGGMDKMHELLGSIAANKSLPQYLRTVSDFLLKSNESMEGIHARDVFTKNLFSMSYSDKITGAGESHFDNKIYLRPDSVKTDKEAAQVALHELVHNRLQSIIAATGFDSRIFKEGDVPINKFWEKKIEEYRKQFPEVVKVVEELERVRYEAFNELRNRLGEEKFKSIGEDIENRDNEGVHLTDDHQLYYALHSAQELVAHVMESKPVADFLNGIKDSKGTTILSRIWDKLLDMIHAFGKALGVKVKDDSLLKTALANTLKLIDGDTRDIDITQHILSTDPIRVNTEAEAEAIKEMMRTVYNKGVSIEGDETGFTINTVNQALRRSVPVPGQRGKILEKLAEQLEEISDTRSRTHDTGERVKLGLRYRDVKNQIDDIRQSTNLDMIAKAGKEQLKWVDEVLSSPHPTAIDVNTALNTATLWANLMDIMYGNLKNVGEFNDSFTEVQREAQKRRIQLINDKARKFLVDSFEHRVTLTPLAFSDHLKDIDNISANTLALTRAKPLLVQATALEAWQKANNRDEHVVRNTTLLHKLESDMKKIGMTGHDMLQLDEAGENYTLVHRFTPQWFDHLKELRSTLDYHLENLSKTADLEPLIRSQKKQELWTKYWDGIRKATTMVDNRHFFDIDTGTRLTGEKADKALEELTKRVGSEKYAKELIDQAQEKYQEYLTEREIIREHINEKTELTDEEIGDKTFDEVEAALEAKRVAEMNSWLRFNSPMELLGKLEGNKDVKFESHGDNWIISVPNKDRTEFFDPKFEKIAGNDKMKAVYDKYLELYQEMVSYLPVEVQDRIPDNHFPVVPRDTGNWLAQAIGKVRNFDAHVMNALTATDVEEALRIRPDKIPVMYIEPRGITKELDSRSTDPIRVLEAFSTMAIQHRYMGEVLDKINIVENVLKDVNRRRLEGQEEGKPLKNVMDALKYLKDSLVFKKPKELQGKIDNKRYAFNPAKNAKIIKDVKDLIKERTALEKERDDTLLEGDFTKFDEHQKKIDEINDKLTAYEKEARSVFGSKVADLLISINQMKALYYNPFSAVSNYTFAAISLGIYARGRTDFTPKDLHAAQLTMMHAMKKYWLFQSEGDPVAQKVHNLMARAGMMGDVVDTDYGKTNLPSSKKSTLRNSLEPMNWQRSGDYFNKGILMVAMMKSKMIEVEEVGTGKTVKIPLWDAFNSEGTWDTTKYKENKEWYSDNIGDQTKWANYRDKMRMVNTMTFGNQDKNAPLMAKKNWLWRMAGQFRMSWFPEGIATRFKPEYYDIALERDSKGRWRTYGDLGLFTSGAIVAKQLLASIPGVKINPFSGHTLKGGKSLEESAIDVENMRKNFSGLAWTVGITAMILGLRSLAGTGRKKTDDDHKRQLLINMLIRNQQDLMLYSSPSVFNTISGNMLPATQVITDYWNAMVASGHYMFGNTKHEKDAFDKWVRKIAKAGIPHPIATQYGKVKTMMTKDLDKLQR